MLKQKGFTLIELIVVIVILGILAATALPKFVDLTGDAQKAAVQGFTGAINGGDSINFSTYLARRTVSDLSVATAGVQDTTGGCTLAVANTLLSQAMPSGYAVTGSTTGTPAGTVNACTLTHTASTQSAPFNITVAK
ncbi:MAG: prepilin-type N-terminal cleavage/methylation domain-containing protein [Propionivibrio sp.]|nr:prepilin-type N-terminal cleavage/methylation domain-containing protein [Propionivibrio sp.]MBK9027960.1 prepilin-type N-terminal cleavage/methylation domain-containing protein [Propionivibrio sp.]